MPRYFVTDCINLYGARTQSNGDISTNVVVGHQQGLRMATAVRADGNMLTGIICGSCYEHEERYLGPQGNTHFRGMIMLHDVNDGEFEPMPVTLRYLERRYA